MVETRCKASGRIPIHRRSTTGTRSSSNHTQLEVNSSMKETKLINKRKGHHWSLSSLPTLCLLPCPPQSPSPTYVQHPICMNNFLRIHCGNVDPPKLIRVGRIIRLDLEETCLGEAHVSVVYVMHGDVGKSADESE